MAGRNRNQVTKLETTIEQCRGEGKWPRVIELADELKSGYPQVESLANFLMGEGKLESYLEEHPPIEDNFLKAKLGLSDAKRYLNSVIGESGKKAGIALDAHLLLAKLFYACGQYDESLQSFVLAELNTLSEKHLSPRSIRILAESYAIKGMCLEKKGAKAPSKFKQAEQETEMITCFERAADLGILFLQGQDNNNQNEVRRMGAVLETGLQRAPIVLIKTGKLQNAIDRYRVMLNAVETKATQTLRQTLARQLAEVLLRGVSGTIYTPPPNLSSSGKSGTGGGSKRLWEPRKYSARQQFIPRNQHEETILLLLIAEALAVRDAVLSQSPEFREARMHTLGNATAVYDLLTLATVRWNQVGLLHDSLEKALKFAFGEAHVWKQYAACLMAMGRYKHAVCALKEHSKLEPQDSLSCLMAARLCYEHLDQIKEGLAFAEEALSRESKGLRRSRAQLYVGIGLQQVAISSNLVSEKDRYNKLASEALERAVQQDPNDHLAEYYLACQHAYNYNITEALLHITNALSLRAEHASSLHLFALLLTANRRPKEALAVVQDATEEFPDNLNLLHVKAHLELYLKDVETALETVQQMLSIWREVYEVQLANAGSGMEHDHEKHSDTRSVLQMQSSQMSDKDSNSIHAASLAASRIEHALSEAASSLSSFSPRPGPQRAWMIQFKIWLLLADVYLAIEQPNEAINCIQEAGLINPVSHQVMYMRGQIHIYQQQWVEAKQSFQNAVAANPYHTEALRALGEAHLTLGEPRLAEKTLKDAARIDPNCPKIWFLLGRVMESLGDYTASADCMATALQLEPSCPVLPFTSIALVFE